MEKNNIRFLKKKETKKLQNFIDKNFSKNHILTKNLKILNFFYNFQNKSNLNFIGYFKSKKLIAILGLIDQRNWDKKIGKDYFISIMCKSKKYHKDVTFKLISFVIKKLSPNMISCLGFNKEIFTIFKNIGYCIKMNHHYILNDKIKSNVSKNLKKNLAKKNDDIKFKITYSLDYLEKIKSFPIKSLKYFNNKYSNNPFYNYFFINFIYKRKVLFFFVARKIFINKFKSSVIRLVDFYGYNTKKHYIADKFLKILYNEQSEYLDFLSFGIDKKTLNSMGFNEKKNNQLIPNYFEPYLPSNKKLDLCILYSKNKIKDLLIFKGDGDQERPNII